MSTMEFSAHKREASPEGLFEQDYKGQKNYSTRKTFDGRNVEERLAGRPYIYDKHEEIPNLPYYDDERIKSIEEYVEIDASKLYNAILLEMPKQRDTQLHHLAEEIHRLLRIDYPVTAIALHGNASTGKSSTLNNVVSKAGLAAASDAGRSCTQVATEYVSRKEDYPPFSAHVHWMSEDRIEKIVGNAADVLIHYYTTRSNEPNANAVADGDAMADDDNYAQVHTAQQFLQSVLCDRPTFLCEVSTAAFFCNNGKEIVARSMLGWIRENLKTTYGTWTTNNVTVVEATNLRLLRRELVPFQERGDDFSKEPRYWPLVDKVRCYIDSPFLQRGIELVDYPGTSDRNMMRRDRYQDDNCSAVLVTHQVSRAQTSQDLFNSLQRAIRIYGAENVILVLTNCDTADTDPYNLTHIENMTFTNLSKNIDKATTAFEDALEQDDIEKEEQARNELDNLKQIQEKRRILIRNEKLEKILQAEYKVLSPSSLIKVYPVANKAYEKHLSGSDRFSSHLLDVEETGIPDLRHAICTIHSERRMLRISEHYRRLRLATARILLFAEYDRLTRKADVDAIVWQQKKNAARSSMAAVRE
ncbi:hypothetical protein AAFC00_005210 [Neodothiora populina]|uniref:Uncharacterized protein n=1 Tax=Neodothiora populina TaxID=2781224 RepID=A0ABR3PKI2_9PEZI